MRKTSRSARPRSRPRVITANYPLGYSDILPEGICGILGGTSLPLYSSFHPLTKKPCIPTVLQPKRPKKSVKPVVIPKAKPSKRTRKNPSLQIDYTSLSLPAYADNLQLDNTVVVSEKLLKRVTKITEKRSDKLSELLLCNSIPSILAYTSSMNYVAAVMKDGFNIDLEEDAAVQEFIKDVVKLEVIEFFVSRLQVLDSRKQLILDELATRVLDSTMKTLERQQKSQQSEQRSKLLEAVLAKRSQPTTSGVVKQKSNNGLEERIVRMPMIQPSTT